MIKELLDHHAKELGITLSEKQLDQFERYATLLTEWNEKINLTAITDPEGIAAKHFADSLTSWKEITEIMKQKKPEEGPVSLIDVGTGAGFPGIPLKILFPSMKVTLLDALQKRINFLQTVIDELGLEGICCVHERAEDGAHKEALREQFDFACARAVAQLPVLLEYCGGYVKKGGEFLAYKGPGITEELSSSKRAQKVLNMRFKKLIDMPDGELSHVVAVFTKTGQLCLQYPRKQSKIKNNPLISKQVE